MVSEICSDLVHPTEKLHSATATVASAHMHFYILTRKVVLPNEHTKTHFGQVIDQVSLALHQVSLSSGAAEDSSKFLRRPLCKSLFWVAVEFVNKMTFQMMRGLSLAVLPWSCAERKGSLVFALSARCSKRGFASAARSFCLLDLLGRGARCNGTAGGRAAHSRHSLLASFLVLAVGLLVRSPTGLLIQYEVLRVSPYRFGKDVRLGWLGVL